MLFAVKGVLSMCSLTVLGEGDAEAFEGRAVALAWVGECVGTLSDAVSGVWASAHEVVDGGARSARGDVSASGGLLMCLLLDVLSISVAHLDEALGASMVVVVGVSCAASLVDDAVAEFVVADGGVFMSAVFEMGGELRR